jgi:hypothetical protein
MPLCGINPRGVAGVVLGGGFMGFAHKSPPPDRGRHANLALLSLVGFFFSFLFIAKAIMWPPLFFKGGATLQKNGGDTRVALYNLGPPF